MNRLLSYRKSRKLSQKTLAYMIGISQPTLSEFESGLKRPSPETALKIEEVTGIKAESLIFEKLRALTNA